MKSQVSRREIINEKKAMKRKQKNKENKSQLFQEINKIDKTRLMRKKGYKLRISGMREVTLNDKGTKRIIGNIGTNFVPINQIAQRKWLIASNAQTTKAH